MERFIFIIFKNNRRTLYFSRNVGDAERDEELADQNRKKEESARRRQLRLTQQQNDPVAADANRIRSNALRKQQRDAKNNRDSLVTMSRAPNIDARRPSIDAA